MRALGIDPIHDTRRTFRSLLDAMSRPGTVEPVPEPADHAVVATLVDHEVTVATDDSTLRDALAGEGRLSAAPPESADVVHVLDHTAVDARDCRRGSLVEPSDGATIIYAVDAVSPDPGDDPTTVELSGPGVDGTATFAVSLPPAALDELAAAQSDYPRGVDAVFAGDRGVAAIPRSATIERTEVR